MRLFVDGTSTDVATSVFSAPTFTMEFSGAIVVKCEYAVSSLTVPGNAEPPRRSVSLCFTMNVPWKCVRSPSSST